jgi:hypothetical protein
VHTGISYARVFSGLLSAWAPTITTAQHTNTLLLLGLGSPPLVTLLRNSKLDTLALGQRDPRLGTLTNDKNVRHTISKKEPPLKPNSHPFYCEEEKNAPSSESPVKNILHVDNVESSDMSFTVHDSSGTAHIATTSDDNDVSGIKLDKVGHFALLQVVLDGIVDRNVRIWIADCSSVVSDEVRYTTVADQNFLDWREEVWLDRFDGPETEETDAPLHSL